MDLSVNVSRIRKSKIGYLMITVEGGHGKAEKMGRAIEAQGGDFEVTVRKERSGKVWIYGLDLATTDEEIEKIKQLGTALESRQRRLKCSIKR